MRQAFAIVVLALAALVVLGLLRSEGTAKTPSIPAEGDTASARELAEAAPVPEAAPSAEHGSVSTERELAQSSEELPAAELPEATESLPDLWFLIGTEEQVPLHDAALTLSWPGGSATAKPRPEDAFIRVPGVPAGVVQIEARSPGFAPRRYQKAVPWSPPSVECIALDRAGVVTGEVVLADGGVPEAPTRVCYWGNGVRGVTSTTLSSDGRQTFRVDDAPLGQVHLTAVSSTWGVGDALSVGIGPGEERRVSLSLCATRAIQGRVIDATSGAAIAGASVELLPSGWEATAGEPEPLSPVATTDSSGTFSLRCGMPADVSVRLSAPGYCVRVRSALAPEGDLGDVPLARSQSLTVCLLTQGSVPDGWWVETGDDRFASSSFDRDGCVVFDDCSDGPLRLFVHEPDQDLIVATTTLRPGTDWRIPIAIEGHRSALVDFDLPAAPVGDLILSVEDEPSPGLFVTRTVDEVEDLVPVRFEGIEGSSVTARLRVVGGADIGTAQGHLPAGEREIRLTIRGGGARSFQLVDADGEPLEGAQLYVATVGGKSTGVLARADDEGRCRLQGLPEDELAGMLTHPRGVRPGVPIDRAEGVQTIVLDPSGSLELTVREAGAPVVGASCLLADPKVGRAVFPPTSTDGQGMVVWNGLHEGQYRLQVRQPGFASIDRDVEVSPGEVLRLVVEAERQE